MTLTIASAAAAMRRGELTPVRLLDQCLARIDQLEERVRAWVFVDREIAREQAVRLTDELARGLDRGRFKTLGAKLCPPGLPCRRGAAGRRCHTDGQDCHGGLRGLRPAGDE